MSQVENAFYRHLPLVRRISFGTVDQLVIGASISIDQQHLCFSRSTLTWSDDKSSEYTFVCSYGALKVVNQVDNALLPATLPLARRIIFGTVD